MIFFISFMFIDDHLQSKLDEVNFLGGKGVIKKCIYPNTRLIFYFSQEEMCDINSRLY